MKKNLNVLFVGAFNRGTKDGSSGGQLFACTSLIESDLKNSINFIKLDTTAETVPAPPVYKRIPKVFLRLSKFLYSILFRKIDVVLIFSSAKLSFIEKGLMAYLASVVSKKVIFAPRSGLILNDYERSKFMKSFIPFVVRSSTYILCQSTNWKEFYKSVSGEKDEKFVIVNNWIDIAPYLQNKETQINSTLEIVYLGWLEEYKGIRDLLTALKILSQKQLNVDFKCTIYGNGNLFEEASQFIKDNGLEQVAFLKGWANKEVKMNAFRTADIYILPSHYEGFPNALLEAMASQLPVVVTRIMSVADIVQHGVNGMIAECKDPASLAEQLEKLLLDENLRLEIAKNARETVINKFTIQTAIQKLEKIFYETNHTIL
ncbi:glycosyltransferase family 4 protein [Pedobacter psychroterrae]|uniref:Glycosyltransferase family 1 protein n=1 Tax=Pedobacter psychroterrae TaxID=2530453 RepID=A0A4V2MLN1_9SPHI|nr:glycosyltransferase family 4 protein [Pedobacter psychroterrae]TCD02697.1 glycosyltransferase family 1 protein [Pedobacter psychroterrae]